MGGGGEKGGLRRKGHEKIQIKTLHGTFVFEQPRFLDASGQEVRFLRATKQGPVSSGLEEFCLYYCTRMSFLEVQKLVARVTGASLACQQTLWNWVGRRAALLDARTRAKIKAAEGLPLPLLSEQVDLYAKDAEEVLLFEDAIGVKAQKPKRDKPGQPTTGKRAKRHDFDLMALQKRDGGFTYIGGTTDQKTPVTEVAKAVLRLEWGQAQTPLNLVAITDGANCIRTNLDSLFGCRIAIILDWYHLERRVYERLSMCASGKAQREEWERTLLAHLWHGRVQEALAFLRPLCTRHPEKHADLIGYLEKHQEEIIDYERRKALGKCIGSGRVENGVDQAIGKRQKDDGMSWSKAGSHALAHLKIAQMNAEWNQLFAVVPMAA
jgi:hypothetical protein